MEEFVFLIFGIAFIVGGVFLFRRGRAMWRPEDYQMNSKPDTWYDFTHRLNMFAFAFAMWALGALAIYKALVRWLN